MNFIQLQPDWHKRFLEQAQWTAGVRSYIYQKTGLQNVKRVLEVGCGTGVITKELHQYSPAKIFGIDINPERIHFAQHYDPQSRFSIANGLSLPFTSGSFDIILCHFYLMWVKPALVALQEMKRVCRTGGLIIILAEPDYRHRIDYPQELEQLGKLQSDSLFQQGADPWIGVRVPELMKQCGLKDIQYGLPGGEWFLNHDTLKNTTEREVLINDLSRLSTKQEIEKLFDADQTAWQTGNRVLFVPTFFGVGIV